MKRNSQRFFLGFTGVATLLVFGFFYFFPDQISFNIFSEKKKQGLFYDVIGSYKKEHQKEYEEERLEKVYYTIEFGVFKTEEDAREQVDILAEKKIEAFYSPMSTEEGTLYRVRKGLYSKQKTAEEEASRVELSTSISAKALKF